MTAHVAGLPLEELILPLVSAGTALALAVPGALLPSFSPHRHQK
jgi:hypothetical protein